MFYSAEPHTHRDHYCWPARSSSWTWNRSDAPPFIVCPFGRRDARGRRVSRTPHMIAHHRHTLIHTHNSHDTRSILSRFYWNACTRYCPRMLTCFEFHIAVWMLPFLILMEFLPYHVFIAEQNNMSVYNVTLKSQLYNLLLFRMCWIIQRNFI